VWGAPSEEQKRLAPLLAGLGKLCDARVTAATMVTAFHKRSLLPLAQRRAFMLEMSRDVPWAGTRMLVEPASASNSCPGRKDHAPGPEELPGGADAP